MDATTKVQVVHLLTYYGHTNAILVASVFGVPAKGGVCPCLDRSLQLLGRSFTDEMLLGEIRAQTASGRSPHRGWLSKG